MKLIFLDFDGVLNSGKWAKAEYERTGKGGLIGISPDAVKLLNQVIERTGALVVVSSTWRLGRTRTDLQEILGNHGFTGRVLDKTGTEPDRERGHQIQHWLDHVGSAHPQDIESFVIVDDDSDMAHLMHKLVRTSWEDGLTQDHVERIVTMLNGGGT